ncbi:MAG: MarR family transcriptional regulator [Alphaproteobacteria bacterium PA4]|nr:MAG: MarR family transcriptional regulator [Alphaproteobacteria bacterium PA4]
MTDDPIAFEVFNEIGIIEQLARNAVERVLPRGITLSQFSVLNNFVRLGGERSPAGLATAFQVTRQTMTNTLQRLEAAGYVAIRPDPGDGRAKIVAITEAGRAMRQDCITAQLPLLAELEQILPAAELAALLPGLRVLRQRLDAARNPVA